MSGLSSYDNSITGHPSPTVLRSPGSLDLIKHPEKEVQSVDIEESLDGLEPSLGFDRAALLKRIAAGGVRA